MAVSTSLPHTLNQKIPLIEALRKPFRSPFGWLLLALYGVAGAIFLYQQDFKGLAFGLGVTLLACLFAWAGLKLREKRWERTRSLFPLALLHALVNTIAFM